MIAIIDCGSNKVPALESILSANNISWQTILHADVDSLDFAQYSAVIISGSPILLTQIDTKKEIQRFDFIRTIDKPILGICYGLQIISLVFGGSVSIDNEIKKTESINILHHTPFFDGISNFEFDENHSEHVTVPNNFVLIAKSATCANEAMIHTTLPIFAVQFHPETSGKQGQKLIENFLSHFIIS